MTTDEYIARSFKALSHPRRAMIFRYLTEADDHTATYATLQGLTGLADSTLVHHLREMEKGGLLTRRRIGVYASYALHPGELLRTARVAQNMVLRDAIAA